jgi:hypothetical protein
MSDNVLQPSSTEDWDQFFSQFAWDFLNFAADHNLRVEKYWHGLPCWRFSFKHPKGGLSYIEVFREGQNEISISGYWWLDSYDEGKRFTRKQQSEILVLDALRMSDLLRATLDVVVAWPLDSWSSVATGFGDSWNRSFTKEQFLRLSDDYPQLIFRSHRS